MVHDYVPFIHAAIKQQEDARTDLAAHSQVIGQHQHLSHTLTTLAVYHIL